MEGFPFVHRERARFGDCDPIGHANDAACDRVVAEARGVLVGYDYAEGESIALSDDWKRRLAA